MLKGNKSEKIRKLLAKGVDRKDIEKQLNVSAQLVYSVAVREGYLKKGKKKKAAFKSPRSKIIQAVMQAKQALDAVKPKSLTDEWESNKAFWKTMRGQYGDGTAEVMDQLVDPKPIFGEITATSDPVNNPPHYRTGGIETIDFIEAKDLNYRLGNVVKYVSRAGRKLDSNPVEDLEKAAWYLNREIEARRNA